MSSCLSNSPLSFVVLNLHRLIEQQICVFSSNKKEHHIPTEPVSANHTYLLFGYKAPTLLASQLAVYLETYVRS